MITANDRGRAMRIENGRRLELAVFSWLFAIFARRVGESAGRLCPPAGAIRRTNAERLLSGEERGDGLFLAGQRHGRSESVGRWRLQDYGCVVLWTREKAKKVEGVERISL